MPVNGACGGHGNELALLLVLIRPLVGYAGRVQLVVDARIFSMFVGGRRVSIIHSLYLFAIHGA